LRAAAYRELRTDAAQVRVLLALRAGGADASLYVGGSSSSGPSGRSLVSIDRTIASTVTQIGPATNVAHLGFEPPREDNVILEHIRRDSTRLSEVMKRIIAFDQAETPRKAQQLQHAKAEPFATDLGVACGLAFAPDGTLFVGDRSGTIFRVDAHGHADTFASVPASVAAFHLAIGPDATLYVTAPTLSSYDPVYRVSADGAVTPAYTGFGRPQGLAFDPSGTLFVVEALAGVSGLYRLAAGGAPELVLAGPGLVGVAFDSQGGLVVCSNETAYRLPSMSVRPE